MVNKKCFLTLKKLNIVTLMWFNLLVIWKLVDLNNLDKQQDMFGNAYKSHWKSNEFEVFALIQPDILDNNGGGKYGNQQASTSNENQSSYYSHNNSSSSKRPLYFLIWITFSDNFFNLRQKAICKDRW